MHIHRERKREKERERERERERKNQGKLDRVHQRNFGNSKLVRQILVDYFWLNIFIYPSDF